MVVLLLRYCGGCACEPRAICRAAGDCNGPGAPPRDRRNAAVVERREGAAGGDVARGAGMRPRWELKEHTLIKYLRECVWSLERVESRINMIRHSWSTPCFIPEEVEPPSEGGAPAVTLRPHAQKQPRPRPRSCVSPREFEEQEAAAPRPLSCISNRDDDDDDDVPLYLEGAAGGAEAASSEGTSAVTTPDPSTTPSARVSPSRSSSPPQSLPSPRRCASPSPSRASTRSTLSPARSRVIYRKRKTSMPLPIRIPEDREAYCQSPLFSPLGSPPTSAGAAVRKQVRRAPASAPTRSTTVTPRRRPLG